jgi:uncharacterized protein YcaQ
VSDDAALRLSIEETRGLMLAAQGLLDPPRGRPRLEHVYDMVDRLGAVQIDTITVVKQSQYLVLWSRLGTYDPNLLDALLHPHRRIFEYWSHAASIVPMRDYPYYRADMLRRAYDDHLWENLREWMAQSDGALQRTLEAIRERGPLASADFECPADGRRASPWDWYGPKESRKALDVAWTLGDLMIHSRRGGQKVYDVRERVLAEAFGDAIPRDDELPAPDEHLRYFAARTARALGVVTPSWLWDYFRLRPQIRRLAANGAAVASRMQARALLCELAQAGHLVPATIEGLAEPAYVASERLPDLERLRAGLRPRRTTLLSPFDSLIWDRARARDLFGYEVCFEAYVVPEKRRYGYYCLAILYNGRLVGRLDPKMDRAAKRLLVRAVYLEPGVKPTAGLLGGVAGALRDLARFLGAETICVERGEPDRVASELNARLSA